MLARRQRQNESAIAADWRRPEQNVDRQLPPSMENKTGNKTTGRISTDPLAVG